MAGHSGTGERNVGRALSMFTAHWWSDLDSGTLASRCKQLSDRSHGCGSGHSAQVAPRIAVCSGRHNAQIHVPSQVLLCQHDLQRRTSADSSSTNHAMKHPSHSTLVRALSDDIATFQSLADGGIIFMLVFVQHIQQEDAEIRIRSGCAILYSSCIWKESSR